VRLVLKAIRVIKESLEFLVLVVIQVNKVFQAKMVNADLAAIKVIKVILV
jgi:hypothetical protein